MDKSNNGGYTLIEIIIVVAILSVLASVIIFDFVSFKKTSDLDNSTQEFASVLRLAQNKALSSKAGDKYGVYVNIGVSPNQYILFKGVNYEERDVDYDQTRSLPGTTEFYNVNFAGGNEIIFDMLTGGSEEFGSVSIRNKVVPSQNKTIYISKAGAVGFSPSPDLLDGNRIKDWRHLEFVYSKYIDLANDSIILTFNNSQTIEIKINLYLVGGQFKWQDTVNIGGSDQILEINTHRLNDADTLFSIRRDRRYNNKSLKMEISSDSSGYLVAYTADGSNISHTSIYASNFEQK